jgi:hypothetical protein
VLRHEDSLIFDPRTFTIHKLSPTALELIELFEQSPKSVESVIAQATALNFDPEHVKEFIESAIEAGFLESHSTAC